MKSVADSTPTQRPASSTTGAPLICIRESISAASRSGMLRGSVTTPRLITSSAIRSDNGLATPIMTHLRSGLTDSHRPAPPKAKDVPGGRKEDQADDRRRFLGGKGPEPRERGVRGVRPEGRRWAASAQMWFAAAQGAGRRAGRRRRLRRPGKSGPWLADGGGLSYPRRPAFWSRAGGWEGK